MFHRLNVEYFEHAPFFSPLAAEAPFRSVVRQPCHRAVDLLYDLNGDNDHISKNGFLCFSQVGVHFFL